MYCGKPWNIKNFSKHPVTACNMFVSDYTEHLLFMMLWEHLRCSCPGCVLYFCKQSAPTKDTFHFTGKAAGYCPRPREFLSCFLWHILGRATFFQVAVRSCELRAGVYRNWNLEVDYVVWKEYVFQELSNTGARSTLRMRTTDMQRVKHILLRACEKGREEVLISTWLL